MLWLESRLSRSELAESGDEKETNLRESALREDAVKVGFSWGCNEATVKPSECSNLHQQTGLSAGTVSDDDQLATNFRHLVQS